jgi:hypothetical protein
MSLAAVDPKLSAGVSDRHGSDQEEEQQLRIL